MCPVCVCDSVLCHASFTGHHPTELELLLLLTQVTQAHHALLCNLGLYFITCVVL